jgi:hypothetical protein
MRRPNRPGWLATNLLLLAATIFTGLLLFFLSDPVQPPPPPPTPPTPPPGDVVREDMALILYSSGWWGSQTNRDKYGTFDLSEAYVANGNANGLPANPKLMYSAGMHTPLADWGYWAPYQEAVSDGYVLHKPDGTLCLNANQYGLDVGDLRHTSITNAAAAGTSPAALMARAGHSDFKTTQAYIDLAGERFREEADRLERRLWGSDRYQIPVPNGPSVANAANGPVAESVEETAEMLAVSRVRSGAGVEPTHRRATPAHRF